MHAFLNIIFILVQTSNLNVTSYYCFGFRGIHFSRTLTFIFFTLKKILYFCVILNTRVDQSYTELPTRNSLEMVVLQSKKGDLIPTIFKELSIGNLNSSWVVNDHLEEWLPCITTYYARTCTTCLERNVPKTNRNWFNDKKNRKYYNIIAFK